MEKTEHERCCSGMEISALMLGMVIILLGSIVWLGWHWRIELLTQGLPGTAAMNPVTAGCLILSGLALALQLRRPSSIGGQFAGLLVFIIGSAKLAAYFGLVSFSLDQWFFTEQIENAGLFRGNRIAPNTALCFVLSGIALWLPAHLAFSQIRLAEIVAAASGMIALLTVLGYIYQIHWLYGLAAHIPMALPTAIGFILLAIGILFAKPQQGLMAVATSDTPGGLLLQRMLPALVAALIIAGALRLFGERVGFFDSDLGVALFTVTSIGLSCVFLVSCAISMHRSELDRRTAQAGIIELNAELLRQTSQLELLNREMESFSYSVSHDLRAPLRGISGFAEALEERSQGVLDETSRNYLQRIRNAAGRMGRLIDDLLLLSRLSRSEMKCRTVDFSKLARKVVEELQQQDPQRNVEVTIAPGLKASGDPALLKILLDNLLGNAWKFSAPKSCARIELGIRPGFHTESHLACYIKDNGVGFDNRYRHKLFGAFQRLHSQHEFPGTGIGLATVQRILHRHGCDISAHAEHDSGACFDFTLPKP